MADIWYTKRTPEGIAILPGFFLRTYNCDHPLTEEQQWIIDKYLEPACNRLVEDIERSLIF
jgi:hypothetical protein